MNRDENGGRLGVADEFFLWFFVGFYCYFLKVGSASGQC